MRKRTIPLEDIKRAKQIREDAYTLKYSRKELCQKHGITDCKLGRLLRNDRYGMRGELIDNYGAIHLTSGVVERLVRISHFLYSLNLKMAAIGRFIDRDHRTVGDYLRREPEGPSPALQVNLLTDFTGRFQPGLVTIRPVGNEVMLSRGDEVLFLNPLDLEISVEGLRFDIA